MVRYEKVEGDIHIAWGFDDALDGYFLSVTDKRLAYREESSDDVNKICEKVAMDGGGSYFDLNTYKNGGGFGHKVSVETILAFMLRYKIEIDQIERKDETKGGGVTHVMSGGGETPELRISLNYIEERRARLRGMIEACADRPAPIMLTRVDRTVTELSEQLNISIVRKGLVPPLKLSRAIFFFPSDVYPRGFQECSHPDCRFPEKDEVKYKRCSRCKQAPYCSTVCQKADWKAHKKICQEVK